MASSTTTAAAADAAAAAAPVATAVPPSPPSPASLVRPCLETIVEVSSSKKDLAELASRAKALLDDLERVLRRCEPGEEVIVVAPVPAPAPAAQAPETTEGANDADDEGDAAEKQADAGGSSSADADAASSDVGFFSSVPERGAAQLMALLSSAVETGNARLSAAAADALHRMVAHGVLGGAVHSLRGVIIDPEEENLEGGEGRKVASESGGGENEASTSASSSSPLGAISSSTAAAAAISARAKGVPSLRPHAAAVAILCRCADGATTGSSGKAGGSTSSAASSAEEEARDLATLRGLLSAATSPRLHVHGSALLLLLRAAFSIHGSRRCSPAAAAAARATLLQVATSVFARMEAGCRSAVLPPVALPPDAAVTAMMLVWGAGAMDNNGNAAGGGQSNSSNNSSGASFLADALGAMLGTGNSSSFSNPSTEALARAGTEFDAAFGGRAGAGAGAGAGAAERPSTAQGVSASGAGAADASASASASALETALYVATTRAGSASLCSSPTYAAADAAAKTSSVVEKDHEEQEQTSVDVPALLRRDSYFVFRALCKLSVRADSSLLDGAASSSYSSGSAADAAAAAAASAAAFARGKVLSLELLHAVVSNAGPVFAGDPRLAAALRQHLCLCLLKNARSPTPGVARLAAAVFTAALLRLRARLKAETGVFYPMLLLAPLEETAPVPTATAGAAAAAAAAAASTSEPQPFQHPSLDPVARSAALRCLGRVCADGQLLVDLFVNFDCDLEGASLLERTVAALARIAAPASSNASSSSSATPNGAPAATKDASSPFPRPPLTQEESAMRAAAAACLASIPRSLAAWVQAEEGAAAAAAAAAAATADAEAAALVEAAAADAATAEASLAADGSGGGGIGASLAVARTASAAATSAAAAAANTTATAAVAANASATAAALAQIPAALAARRAYKRELQAAVALFGRKPKAGLAALAAAGVLPSAEDEEAVAALLLRRPAALGLDKAAIGELLGDREEFSLRVTARYVAGLDFTGLEFDEALRVFLSGFRLPGEAQKIDRLVERFAERYLACNPSSFG